MLFEAPGETELRPSDINARLANVTKHIIGIGYDHPMHFERIANVLATLGSQGFAEGGGNATSYALQHLSDLRSLFGAP